MKTTINGQEYDFPDIAPAETAVETIRQRCRLTGTKFVCGSGVCGACTIQVNGTPMVSCLLPATHLADRHIETVEQYDADHLHPVQRAFMAHDGLQCGFCTPGFIMESIAFYERWRQEHGPKEPSRPEVAEALAGHLCRCGAYAGIYAAVQAACAGRFDDESALSPQRVDALIKVTGAAKYTADIQLAGQQVGRILRSPYPHARIQNLDFSAAEKLPGVTAVIDLLPADKTVRYVGQSVAAVAAETAAAAAAALAAIEVTAEQRPHVIGIDNASRAEAPEVWLKAHRQAPSAAEGLTFPGRWQGNVRRSLVNTGGITPGRAHRQFDQTAADGGHTIEQQTYNQVQVHTALEPHCAVAHWPDETHLTLYLSTQAVMDMQQSVAERFDLPRKNVTIIAEHVGGGFGAKNYLFDEAIAAISLAKKSGSPVAVIPDRAEEMHLGGMRPGGRFNLKIGADKDGNLQALIAQGHHDGGVAIGNISATLAGMGYSGGARDLQDTDVVNNHPPGKPFRGPGGPGAFWAVEQAVDQFAHNHNLDAVTLRRQWTKDEKRLRLYDWVENLEVWQERPAAGAEDGRYRRGVGVAFGHWWYFYDPETTIELKSSPAGFAVSTATQEIGNGVRTSLARIVADTFGLEPTQVQVNVGHSDLPYGPRAGGSRVTASIYEPTREAATLLRDRLFGLAAETLDLEAASYTAAGIQHQSGSLSWPEALANLPPQQVTTNRGADPQLMQRLGSRVANRIGMDLMFGSGTAHAAVVAEVEVDTLLGKTRVTRVWENLAIGRVHFPDMARSQVYGGIIQGIGHALYEEKIIDAATGQNLTTNLQDYHIPGIGDIPEMTVEFTDGGFEDAKGQGVGMSELCIIPVPAAVANAVFNATGWRPVNSPIQPEQMVTALQKERFA